MGILLLLWSVFALLVSLVVGVLILTGPGRVRRPSFEDRRRSAAICLLLSGVMAIFAMTNSLASQANTGSMAQNAHEASDAFGAWGACIGFGLTGSVGVLQMLHARASRKS